MMSRANTPICIRMMRLHPRLWLNIVVSVVPGFYLRPKGRDFFYEVLFSNSEKAMGNIPDAWKADVKAELRGLARGEVRDVSVGLHR